MAQSSLVTDAVNPGGLVLTRDPFPMPARPACGEPPCAAALPALPLEGLRASSSSPSVPPGPRGRRTHSFLLLDLPTAAAGSAGVLIRSSPQPDREIAGCPCFSGRDAAAPPRVTRRSGEAPNRDRVVAAFSRYQRALHSEETSEQRDCELLRTGDLKSSLCAGSFVFTRMEYTSGYV